MMTLVERLRGPGCCCHEAADRIEELEAEVARWKSISSEQDISLDKAKTRIAAYENQEPVGTYYVRTGFCGGSISLGAGHWDLPVGTKLYTNKIGDKE